MCRFGGHCQQFYSVAQHCCLGALWGRYDDLASKRDQFNFLMHDASETYLADLPRPLKHGMGRFADMYREIEDELDGKLALRFNLSYPMLPRIKRVDTRMLLTERRDLLASTNDVWEAQTVADAAEQFPLFTARVLPWSPKLAEDTFLQMFKDLSS